MYKLAEKIGNVFQNPKSQFFYTDSSAEIAFGLENRGVQPDKIRKRIVTTANDLEIENLLGRNIFKLSGGEKQIIAFIKGCILPSCREVSVSGLPYARRCCREKR